MLMVRAIGWFLLGKGDQKISWEKPLENQKESISSKFGELCRARGGTYAVFGEDKRPLLREIWHQFQHFVMRHTKRGEGKDVCLRHFTLDGTLNLAIYSS